MKGPELAKVKAHLQALMDSIIIQSTPVKKVRISLIEDLDNPVYASDFRYEWEYTAPANKESSDGPPIVFRGIVGSSMQSLSELPADDAHASLKYG
uniref:HORMA domain-containing protein n=1 Tax=Ditylenchus dipsaci TaxID=166011 RepID=A0A915EE01_9BILA